MIVRGNISYTNWKLNNTQPISELDFKRYKSYLDLIPSNKLKRPSTVGSLWEALKQDVIITCIFLPLFTILAPILDSDILDKSGTLYTILHAIAFALGLVIFFMFLGMLRTLFNYMIFIFEYKSYVSELTREVRESNSYNDYVERYRSKNNVNKETALTELEKERAHHTKYMPPIQNNN